MTEDNPNEEQARDSFKSVVLAMAESEGIRGAIENDPHLDEIWEGSARDEVPEEELPEIEAEDIEEVEEPEKERVHSQTAVKAGLMTKEKPKGLRKYLPSRTKH